MHHATCMYLWRMFLPLWAAREQDPGHANLGQSVMNTEAARTALARDAGIHDLRCAFGLKLAASMRAAGMQVQHSESP